MILGEQSGESGAQLSDESKFLFEGAKLKQEIVASMLNMANITIISADPTMKPRQILTTREQIFQCCDLKIVVKKAENTEKVYMLTRRGLGILIPFDVKKHDQS